jgi:outer membrane protein assembly factor BamB
MHGQAGGEWPTFRHDGARSGSQPVASPLSDPHRVSKLLVMASWRTPDGAGFSAGPIVAGSRVFVASHDGHVYALDAITLRELWRYPATDDPALVQRWRCTGFPSSTGLASSVAVARVADRPAVIIGGPDNSPAPHYGSGRLFAVDAATGRALWASPVLANVTDTIVGSAAGAHEHIGYSAPLVLGQAIYIGLSDACADHPVQTGRVSAVALGDGRLVPGFRFVASGGRGGGVWSSVATDGLALFVTTGNAHCVPAVSGCPESPPPADLTSSIVRVDPTDGRPAWRIQPVPFALDSDSDFGAGATVMFARCGEVITAVQKDGWVYAVDGGAAGTVRWQFPAVHYPFAPGDGTHHVGNTHSNYTAPGAVWKDLFIVTAGGIGLTHDPAAGHGTLQALDVCAPDSARVRWMIRLPRASTRWDGLSPPSVSRGIVFIGTNDGASGSVIAVADPGVVRPRSPEPVILASVAVHGGVRAEPALAYGRVYVATTNGYVEMLTPGTPNSRP